MTAVVATEVSPSAPAAAPGGRFAALDGLRALAALAVVATHAGFQTGRSLDDGPAAPFLARLDFGVTVFFLLSGFLLYRPWALAALEGRPGPSVRGYARRRAVRILPAYWLVIVVTLALATDEPHGPVDWVRYLTLTQSYAGPRIDPMLTQMWSLVVEVAFYVVLPLLAALAARRGGGVRRQMGVLAGLVVAALAWQALATAGVVPREPARGWLPAFLDWFALGMGLALAHAALTRRGAAAPRRLRTLLEVAAAPGTCWVVAGLLFWLATTPIAGPRSLVPPTGWEWAAKHWLYGLAATFLLLPAVLGPADSPLCQVLGSRPMRWLGEVSYGVFLWHLTLLMLLRQALGMTLFSGSFLLLYATTVPLSLAVAALSYHQLERPLMRRARGGREPAGHQESASSAPTTTPTASAQPS